MNNVRHLRQPPTQPYPVPMYFQAETLLKALDKYQEEIAVYFKDAQDVGSELMVISINVVALASYQDGGDNMRTDPVTINPYAVVAFITEKKKFKKYPNPRGRPKELGYSPEIFPPCKHEYDDKMKCTICGEEM